MCPGVFEIENERWMKQKQAKKKQWKNYGGEKCWLFITRVNKGQAVLYDLQWVETWLCYRIMRMFLEKCRFD